MPICPNCGKELPTMSRTCQSCSDEPTAKAASAPGSLHPLAVIALILPEIVLIFTICALCFFLICPLLIPHVYWLPDGLIGMPVCAAAVVGAMAGSLFRGRLRQSWVTVSWVLPVLVFASLGFLQSTEWELVDRLVDVALASLYSGSIAFAAIGGTRLADRSPDQRKRERVVLFVLAVLALSAYFGIVQVLLDSARHIVRA